MSFRRGSLPEICWRDEFVCTEDVVTSAWIPMTGWSSNPVTSPSPGSAIDNVRLQFFGLDGHTYTLNGITQPGDRLNLEREDGGYVLTVHRGDETSVHHLRPDDDTA